MCEWGLRARTRSPVKLPPPRILLASQMFMGNVDDDSVARNNLEYPIVARYICFNPQRWHQFISMRVEMFGCRFGESAARRGCVNSEWSEQNKLGKGGEICSW